ncbi:HK97 gp10 family phage protein [Sinorhizobium meliloti]|uniref:HK97 gp10 family phage protein n=1 Tax=Rhizobium meliloti TaxID=382 RepID=A0A2J0YVI1_RHIML|nr:HK97 gp10 family phage protein [Sinorhizobium meliloti]PJR11553.1 hypothetical protein CEJ86_27725 [Sinorhizobium meliloti]
MALKAKVLGREALTRRLNELAPAVEKYAAEAKIEIAKEAATRIAARAPRGATGDYAASIQGARLADSPDKRQVGITRTKDKDAAGIFTEFIWRFLEFGTAPHSTLPGGVSSANGSMHPGIAAQPHVFHTWRAYRKAARRKLLAAVNKGVREAQGRR